MGILTENSDEMNRSQDLVEPPSDFAKMQQFLHTSRNYLNQSISGEDKKREEYNSFHDHRNFHSGGRESYIAAPRRE